MSYGHSTRRDERRRVATANLEKSIQSYKQLLAGNAQAMIETVPAKTKLERAELVLAQTQANQGKGTKAMNKKVRRNKNPTPGTETI